MMRARATLLAAAINAFSTPASGEVPKLPEKLDDFAVALDARIASDTRGHTAVFELERQRFSTWNARGKRTKVCDFQDPQLSGAIGMMGYSNDRAILSFNDSQRLLVVDLGACRVSGQSETADVLLLGFQATKDGWLAEAHVQKTGNLRILDINLKGRAVGDYRAKALESDTAASEPVFTHSAIPVAAGGEVWLVPRAKYSLLRPAQKGREEFELSPPECLASKGRQLTKDENVKYIEALVAKNPKQNKVLGDRLREASEGRSTTWMGAVSAAATWRDLAAVMVRSLTNFKCRLDVWDLSSTALVATVPVEGSCPGSFSFSEDGYWIAKGTGFEFTPLPSLSKPIEKPCDATKHEAKKP